MGCVRQGVVVVHRLQGEHPVSADEGHTIVQHLTLRLRAGVDVKVEEDGKLTTSFAISCSLKKRIAAISPCDCSTGLLYPSSSIRPLLPTMLNILMCPYCCDLTRVQLSADREQHPRLLPELPERALHLCLSPLYEPLWEAPFPRPGNLDEEVRAV